MVVVVLSLMVLVVVSSMVDFILVISGVVCSFWSNIDGVDSLLLEQLLNLL